MWSVGGASTGLAALTALTALTAATAAAAAGWARKPPVPASAASAWASSERSSRRTASRASRAAKVVDLRFFGGLENEAIADALDVSLATVKRDWTLARAWLHRELGGGAAV